MAHPTKPERQPSERPILGRCQSCGLGFRALKREWTQCRACYWAARSGRAPVDDRAVLRPVGRELPDGSFRPAAPAVPRFARERNKAKGRAATLRLMALARAGPARWELQAAAAALEAGVLSRFAEVA